MGGVLKTNMALTKLCLSCEHKRNNTRMVPSNDSLFSIYTKSTVNDIGDAGATSISDALKTNTTLTKLDLGREDRSYTNYIHRRIHSFSILVKSTVNKIGERGTQSLSDALKINTTLTALCLASDDKKRNNT